MEADNAYKEQILIQIKKPKQYKVIMYNDDFTPMDFVVAILMEVFHKSEEEASVIMYTVHYSEYAVVGIYVYDIANTKAEEAVRRAREQGYPLRVKIESE